MKHFLKSLHWMIPAIFVIVHGPEGDSARSYTGMTVGDIVATLATEGKTGTFVTEEVYNAFVLAHTPPDRTPAETNLLYRELAVSDLQTSIFPDLKLFRAVVLLTMDEINLLRERDRDRSADVAAATSLADLKARWAARSALADRTNDQLKTAIINRINAGSAD